jgi:hypothetical protein
MQLRHYISMPAAVAPSATVRRGRTRLSSLSSHQLQASISPASGFLCNRRLPRGSFLKCLFCPAALIKRDAGSVRFQRPGAMKGRPMRSSFVARLLADEIIAAGTGPSPNTVWVALTIGDSAGMMPPLYVTAPDPWPHNRERRLAIEPPCKHARGDVSGFAIEYLAWCRPHWSRNGLSKL